MVLKIPLLTAKSFRSARGSAYTRFQSSGNHFELGGGLHQVSVGIARLVAALSFLLVCCILRRYSLISDAAPLRDYKSCMEGGGVVNFVILVLLLSCSVAPIVLPQGTSSRPNDFGLLIFF